MRKYITRNDIILIAILLLAPVLITIVLYVTAAKGEKVCVYVDGAYKGEYPLDRDATVEIEGYQNTHNTLMIKNGRAYMSEASCPDKLCIHQGKISEEGRSIVCLPNRVIVSIEGEGEDEYDAFTR